MRFVLFLMLPVLFFGEVVREPVVNVYLRPEAGTEVDTQAIYGTVVEVLEEEKGWSKIALPDGKKGWVSSSQLLQDRSFETHPHLRPVKNLFAHIYRVADTIPFSPLMTLPFGAKVQLEKVEDTGERWVSIILAGGEKAWIQRGDIEFTPKEKTLSEMLAFSKKFLGLPYTWGGTSSFGFDCSGFMQMLFQQMGVLLPRDSKDQASSEHLISVSREELKPGDLLFFGNTRITHVGLYLGNEEFIHSDVTEAPLIIVSNLGSGKYNLLEAKRLRVAMLNDKKPS